MLGLDATLRLAPAAFRPPQPPEQKQQQQAGKDDKDAVGQAALAADRSTLLTAFGDLVLKAMNSAVVGMMEGSLHDSEVALEGYFRLYQLLLGVGSLHPPLLALLQGRVTGFLSDPLQRSKASCPSLGELLPLLPLAEVPFAGAVEAVLAEAFVRNARWALKACPALADTDDGPPPSSSEDAAGGQQGVSSREAFRLRSVLAANAVSLRLLGFHCAAAGVVAADCGGGGPLSQAARLEATRGKPSAQAVACLQRRTRGLKSGLVGDWGAFFAGVGLPTPRPRFLAAWLRQSVVRSASLGYHHHGAALRAAKEAADRAAWERWEKAERLVASAEEAKEEAAAGKVRKRGGGGGAKAAEGDD
jgi:hypothetical protein